MDCLLKCKSYRILFDIPEYPHRLSICEYLPTVCSLPVIEHLGTSKKPTGGFGLTVKCKNSDTHSRSVKIPDCAGPCANSSTVIKGNRICAKILPSTPRLFSGVGCKFCLTHSASDHFRTALNNLASLILNESRSRTALKVLISMSVKPSAPKASGVFLSMVSRQSAAN